MFVGKQVDSHAMACHNPVLSLVADGMARVIRLVPQGRVRVILLVRAAFDRDVDAHSAVVQALRDLEPELARTAMQEAHALWRRESGKVSVLHAAE